jgi:putative membrane protein
MTSPDPRFLLANERTLLAWLRTALALQAGGLGVLQFRPSGTRWGAAPWL